MTATQTPPDYNPQLKDWAKIIPSSEPDQGRIEAPGGFDNRVWQTRERVPEAFELALIEGLETVFTEGAGSLPDIITGLNNAGYQDRQGEAWTEASFLQEMAILGR
ncbi:recombinase-like helix-turn-helix domain-containing protein [Saccharospirillum impatiens]|uniref:recombinase-like helix-turn-helix domain-containing protein n=1 Tax=Saccharospirillum impatiens TaxID=169438 RepID=UPI00041E9192|nr:recombinase-like helix-turn-helix domain-containing protein [Saccharospirillum impatiens]